MCLENPRASQPESRVDFSYAFAPPHRLTVCRPDSSDKTLLDVQPGSLRIAWTYDDLRRFPLGAYAFPRVDWEIIVQPQIDGHPFGRSTWSRAEGYLPVLDNTYLDSRGWVHLEVAGGEEAAIARVQVTNTGDRPHRFSLYCQRPGGLTGYNPAWVDPSAPADLLLAGWQDRADRVILLALGADEYAVPDANTVWPTWVVQPGETRTGWLVRPYRAYRPDLTALRAQDWAAALEAAKAEWRALLSRASRVEIPDPGVEHGFYACLADLFVMREPVAGGQIAPVPGTEVYRAPGAVEGGIVAIALDQVGLPEESVKGYQVCLEQQGADGDWDDPLGWGHLMWAVAGFKAWVVMEHYRLTGDRDYLAQVYPRLAAHSRWQEQQRARTRVLIGGEKPITYGLMPRGMGDCGLKDGDDLYGVFLPHNIWSVYADRIAVEAAEILGREEDLPELREIYQRGLADLLVALERGAIQEEGYRWIPGVPGKTSGSRWGALNALFPCRILSADHELISGTIRHLEAHLSPGGIPINTGWMTDGMWVAITLDNLAEAHLARGDGDAAAEYLYAVLNHGTPLYTWCEERGQEPGTSKTSGDRQHQWTPVAVVRAIRDCLVMEEGDGLHLALGTPRGWLASGKGLGIMGARTHFGPLSYSMRYDPAISQVRGWIAFPVTSGLAWAKLHIRLPGGHRVVKVNPESGATVLPSGDALEWRAPRGEVEFEAMLG